MNQCKKCVFRNDDDYCEIKKIDINEVDYSNCWFFRNQDVKQINDFGDEDDFYE